MPDGMSGRELADRLQKGRPQLRVIFTSGYSTDFAGRELVLKDGQSFLQKPSTPKEIRSSAAVAGPVRRDPGRRLTLITRRPPIDTD